jgi:hypothetical protein
MPTREVEREPERSQALPNASAFEDFALMDRESVGHKAIRAGERPSRGTLLIWVLVPLTLVVVLEACGWASLLRTTTLTSTDTRSQLSADYQPWPRLSFEPVAGQILDEIERDTGQSALLEDGGSSGWFWPTPGSTRTPTATPFPSQPGPVPATGTSIGATATILGPTPTSTLVAMATATRTPPPTSIPPATQAPPPPPTSGPPGGGQQGTDQPNGNN